MDRLSPPGLSDNRMERLSRLAKTNATETPESLLEAARNRLMTIRRHSSATDFKLAEAICDRLFAVVTHWQRIPVHSRPWLKAAIAYFSVDSEDGIEGPHVLDFAGDCEVLNACLELAWRDDLCIDPVEFGN